MDICHTDCPSIDAGDTQTFGKLDWCWLRLWRGTIRLADPPLALQAIENILRYSVCHACPHVG